MVADAKPLPSTVVQECPRCICALQESRMGLWGLQACRHLFCYHQRRPSAKATHHGHPAVYRKVGVDLWPLPFPVCSHSNCASYCLLACRLFS